MPDTKKTGFVDETGFETLNFPLLCRCVFNNYCCCVLFVGERDDVELTAVKRLDCSRVVHRFKEFNYWGNIS